MAVIIAEKKDNEHNLSSFSSVYLSRFKNILSNNISFLPTWVLVQIIEKSLITNCKFFWEKVGCALL